MAAIHSHGNDAERMRDRFILQVVQTQKNGLCVLGFSLTNLIVREREAGQTDKDIFLNVLF